MAYSPFFNLILISRKLSKIAYAVNTAIAEKDNKTIKFEAESMKFNIFYSLLLGNYFPFR